MINSLNKAPNSITFSEASVMNTFLNFINDKKYTDFNTENNYNHMLEK